MLCIVSEWWCGCWVDDSGVVVEMVFDDIMLYGGGELLCCYVELCLVVFDWEIVVVCMVVLYVLFVVVCELSGVWFVFV